MKINILTACNRPSMRVYLKHGQSTSNLSPCDSNIALFVSPTCEGFTGTVEAEPYRVRIMRALLRQGREWIFENLFHYAWLSKAVHSAWPIERIEA